MAGVADIQSVASGDLAVSNSTLQATVNTVIIFSGNLQSDDSQMSGFLTPNIVTPSGRIAIVPALFGRIAIVER